MKTKKYIFLIYIIFILIFTLSSCKDDNKDNESEDSPKEDIVIKSPTNLSVDANFQSKTLTTDYLLSFDKVDDCDGYTIKVGTRDEFTTKTTTVSITKLVKVTANYDIVVKAYKEIDGITYYSEPSKINETIKKVTSSMTYNLLEDGTYEVTCESCSKADITGTVSFPDLYNGVKVTKLAKNCLYRRNDSGEVIGYDDDGNKIVHVKSGVNSSTTDIIFPKYVTTLGESCFSRCIKLEKVVIPNTVIDGNEVFINCTSLKEVVIPEGIESINWFYNCSSLVEINLPSSVKTLYNDCFLNCVNLEKINLENVEIIEGRAFENTKFIKQYTDDFVVINKILYKYQGTKKELYLEDYPEDISYVNQYFVYDNGNIEYIELPNRWKTLNNIFGYSINLKSVVVADGCEELQGTFASRYNLETVVLPTSITHMTYGTFCSEPKEEYAKASIYYLGTEEQWNNIKLDERYVATKIKVYFYSNEKPTEEGLYWHYVDEKIVVWQ